MNHDLFCEDENIRIIENALKYLGSSIFYKDIEGRYRYMSHTCKKGNSYEDNFWFLYGKTDEEIRINQKNAKKAKETDEEILKTGKEKSYIICEKCDDKPMYIEIRKYAVYDDDGNIIGISGIATDVTEKVEIENLAFKDELTECYNRHYLKLWINQIGKIYPLSVIMVDCNDLKKVNDTLGHSMGDNYLKRIANIFKTCLYKDSFVIRWGGDEFLIVMPNTLESDAIKYLEKVKENMSLIDFSGIDMSASFGLACSLDNSVSLNDLINIADEKMYVEKNEFHKVLSIKKNKSV